MTAKQEIEVYTDGSVTHTTPPYLGSGWVIRSGGDMIHAGSARLENIALPADPKWHIDIAETSAVIFALKTLETGSLLRLYTDCRRIQRFYNEPGYRGYVLRQPDIEPYYQKLRAAFNRHSILSVDLRHDDTDPHIKMAHNLAREASRAQMYGDTHAVEHHVVSWPPKLPPDSYDI